MNLVLVSVFQPPELALNQVPTTVVWHHSLTGSARYAVTSPHILQIRRSLPGCSSPQSSNMVDLVRSYSVPIGSTFQQDERMDAFLDLHGVIRRSSSISKGSLQRGGSVSKAFLQRGGSDLKFDFLAMASPTATLDHNDESETDVPEEEDQHEEPEFVTVSPQELETLKQAQQERKHRRSEMIKGIKERKRSLLISQNASVQDRLQLWHDASELDPAVETSVEHTPLSPSSKSQTFIDADGNIRRKSIAGSDSPHSPSSESPIASPRLSSPMASYTPRVRKSLVWEFVQSIIDD